MENNNNKTPNSEVKNLFIIIGLGLTLLLFIWVVKGKDDNTNSTAKELIDSKGLTIDTTTVDSSYLEDLSKWTYQEDIDKMTNKKIKFASIDANELLYFDSPYDGGVTATLWVRSKNNDLDIYLKITEGQFMDTSMGGTISIKFDDEPARKYNFVGAADYSSDIIFIKSERKLLQKLKSSKKILIEALFYNEGNRVMEFETKDLKF